jgi:hypothetical protein
VILQSTGALDAVASGTWVDDLFRGLNAGDAGLLPTGIYVSTTVSSLITVAGTLFVTAVVAACAGVDAVSKAARPGAVTSRLRGGLGGAAVVSVLAAIAIVFGSFLILVPGLLAFVVWSLATPVAVMERARPGAAFARSARLTRGHRWRILGVTVLIVIITVAIESVFSSIVVGLLPGLSAATSLIVGDVVAAVVSAITLPWVGAVIALLYVDIRIRTENLGPALRSHAAGLA